MASLKQFITILQSAPTISLDTSCFIYHFAANSRYSQFTQTIFSQIEAGKSIAYTSTLAITETFILPEKTASVFELNAYEQFFLHFPNLNLSPPNYPITRLAAKLRAKYQSLRTPDALHLATALFHQTGAFITNDRRLKIIKDLPILILEDYLPSPTYP